MYIKTRIIKQASKKIYVHYDGMFYESLNEHKLRIGNLKYIDLIPNK